MKIDLTTLLHPRFDAIEAFAMGQADDRERTKISAHLRDCARCQDRVRDLRALRTMAQASAVPPMSATLRNRVLDRARDGERSIIPVAAEQTVARPSGRRWIMIASAAAIILVVALVPGRGLDAGPTAGTLSIAQRSTSPAPTFAVKYVPAGTLGRSDRVVLKVATYAARKPFAPVRSEFVLMRGGDGAYAGDVALPEGTVFAQYTVASADGAHVDDNDARGWELAVQDSASRPLFDGLWTQRVVNGMANWERSSAAAKAMLRHYPENPASIRFVMSDEAQLAGKSRADSITRLYRPRVSALHQKLAASALDATTMWEMAMVGSEVGDTAIVNHWRRRMMREYPTDAGTIQQRVFAVSEHRMPKNERLREFDRIWDETGGQGIQLLANAFDLAVELGDSTDIARWGGRVIAHGSGYESTAASAYASLPAFRARGEDLLRASLRAVPPVSASDWREAIRKSESRSTGQRGQWQFQVLGKALLEDGRIAPARDTLRRAASLGWDARTLRALGDAELAAGDSTAAMTAWAWVVADSRTSAARADTLRGKLGGVARGPKWDAALSEGRALITAMTLKTAFRRPFDARASFTDVAGTRRTIGDVIGKRVSVVAFISRYCAPSIGDMASMDAVATMLKQRGVPLVAIIDEMPSAAVAAELAAKGFKGNVGFDDRAEVSRNMRQAGTPHYFVVEDGHVIRFNARRAEDLIMLVEALRAKP